MYNKIFNKMSKHTISEEFKRMQKLAGLNEVEGMSGGMHGEDDFKASIVSHIKEKYPNLVNNREYDKLGAIIEKDFPSLRSDLILQDIFGDDTPEELSTPPNF
jgi:hypothetical protein